MYQRIFGANTIKENNNVVEKDYCCSMIETLIDLEVISGEICQEHLYATYISIKEDSVEILQEGFSDFVNKASEYFKRMIEKIKTFFKRVFTVISSYIGDFKTFIKNNKETLMKLNPDFEIKGYKYTMDKVNVTTNYLEEILDEFNRDITNMDSLKSSEIKERSEKYLSDNNLDKMRARLINSNEPVDSADFITQIREALRNGMSREDDIKVDQVLLRNIISLYDTVDKMYKESVKTRDSLIVLMQRAENYFSNAAKISYKGSDKKIVSNKLSVDNGKFVAGNEVTTNFSDNTIKHVNVYYNFRFKQVKEVSTMCTLVATEKTNAFREQLKLYRDIVRQSLSPKNKGGN